MRVFPPLIVIEDRGRQACSRPLASEADLVRHKEAEVDNPVKEIIDQLAQIPAARDRFALGDGIVFENHINTITEEPGQRLSDSARGVRADQNCVYARNGNRELLYVIEYKAAHKLPDAFLRAGLRPMNVLDEVVRRVTIPVDPEEKLQYDAELLSCAALAQPFEYMILSGTALSVLDNGRSQVMLWIREEDPETLNYCLLNPSQDVAPEIDDGLGFRYPFTATGNRLALTLLARQFPQRSQIWRNNAMNQLHRWNVDFEDILRLIPESERKQTPPGSIYRAPRYPINPRSPYLLRARQLPAGCNENKLSGNSTDPPDSSDESHDQLPRLPSSPIEGLERRKRQRTSHSKPSGSSLNESRRPNREYCTQKCLRGLVCGLRLDLKCPNAQLHRTWSNDGQHPISHLKFVKLISQQLNRDPDNRCMPLWKGGLHGSLFAITLEAYGYTFVGKGTTYSSVFEGDVYRKLRHLQGSAVPVYLGDIHLQRNVYCLGPKRIIVHMSLMAYGGVSLETSGRRDLNEHIALTKAEIQEAGVEHLDQRPANMLWNAEAQRVMFIDFGRAAINEKRKVSPPAIFLPRPKRLRQHQTGQRVTV
ncbi:hypothetical protein KXV43_002563 [Aspergillus fumigatus]|nr:hypothetical protein KXV43_002563 [Aspergillus fumigatus]